MNSRFSLITCALVITMGSCSPGTENADAVIFGDSTFLADPGWLVFRN